MAHGYGCSGSCLTIKLSIMSKKEKMKSIAKNTAGGAGFGSVCGIVPAACTAANVAMVGGTVTLGVVAAPIGFFMLLGAIACGFAAATDD